MHGVLNRVLQLTLAVDLGCVFALWSHFFWDFFSQAPVISQASFGVFYTCFIESHIG